MSAMRVIRYRRNAPRGAVLLLVLAAVALLTLLAVEVSHRAKLDVLEASRLHRDLGFKRGFDSGIEIARGMLTELRSKEGFDHHADKWAQLVEVRLVNELTVRVQITDEASKLKISTTQPAGGNSAAGPAPATTPRAMARVFQYLTKHDAENEEQWKNAEKLVRKRLGIPDVAEEKKASTPDTAKPPVEVARELLTLDGLREEGISGEMVFGRLVPSDEPKTLALNDVFTTFGDGKVNLNTAHPAVLYALDEEYDDALVETILNWRGRSAESGEKSGKVFKTAKELEMVPGVVIEAPAGQPQARKNLFAKVQDRVVVQSRWFSARIELKQQGRQRVGWAYFEVVTPATVRTDVAGQSTIKLLTFEEYEQ